MLNKKDQFLSCCVKLKSTVVFCCKSGMQVCKIMLINDDNNFGKSYQEIFFYTYLDKMIYLFGKLEKLFKCCKPTQVLYLLFSVSLRKQLCISLLMCMNHMKLSLCEIS